MNAIIGFFDMAEKHIDEPEKVMAQAGLIVAVRDHHSLEEMQKQIDHLTDKYGARIQLMDMPGTDVSSALIRKKIKNHRTIRFLEYQASISHLNLKEY